jgi:hypothetical protein
MLRISLDAETAAASSIQSAAQRVSNHVQKATVNRCEAASSLSFADIYRNRN